MRKATVNIKFVELLSLSDKALEYLHDQVSQKVLQYNSDQAKILEDILAEQSKCKIQWLTNLLVKIGYYESVEKYTFALDECKSVNTNSQIYKIFRDELFIWEASKEKEEAIKICEAVSSLGKNYIYDNIDVEIDIVVLDIIQKTSNKIYVK
jgi:hypothetical protein